MPQDSHWILEEVGYFVDFENFILSSHGFGHTTRLGTVDYARSNSTKWMILANYLSEFYQDARSKEPWP